MVFIFYQLIYFTLFLLLHRLVYLKRPRLFISSMAMSPLTKCSGKSETTFYYLSGRAARPPPPSAATHYCSDETINCKPFTL